MTLQAQYTSTTTAFRLTATPASGVALPLTDPSKLGVRPLGVYLQATTANIRFTADGVTTPTASVGAVLTAGANPWLYSGDLISLQFIRESAGAVLNVIYAQNPIAQGATGADGAIGPAGPPGSVTGANSLTVGASLANQLTVAGSATGAPVTVTASGADATIPIWIKPKANADDGGTGAVYIGPDYRATLFDDRAYGGLMVLQGNNTTVFPQLTIAGEDGSVPVIYWVAANGTFDVPTAITGGQETYRIVAFGYGATRYMEGATISVQATANYTDASAPTAFHFQTGYVGMSGAQDVVDRLVLGPTSAVFSVPVTAIFPTADPHVANAGYWSGSTFTKSAG